MDIGSSSYVGDSSNLSSNLAAIHISSVRHDNTYYTSTNTHKHILYNHMCNTHVHARTHAHIYTQIIIYGCKYISITLTAPNLDV